jgi:plastocyanin
MALRLAGTLSQKLKKFTQIMKAKLLFAVLFCTAALSAQTQHIINWSVSSPVSDYSITIPLGDEVVWVWMDYEPHSVTSLPESNETFDSGVQSVGNEPVFFTHTFTEIGENPYYCTHTP